MPRVSDKQTNIIDFISHQEQNLIGGIINLRNELWFMTELDDLYQYLMAWHSVGKSPELLITALYLDVHNSYYSSMLNFLRNNFSVAMMSARRAIDSALTAYHLCIHPEDYPIFYDRAHARYDELFWNIKRHIKKNPAEYPVAKGLIASHELASKWASHTTVESMLHKLKVEKPTKEEDGRLLLHYSEVMDYPTPYLGYYFYLIMIYSMIHGLFWKEFFVKKFKIENPLYEKRIQIFKERLKVMAGKHPLGKVDEEPPGTIAGEVEAKA